jgi:hypothetical protein
MKRYWLLALVFALGVAVGWVVRERPRGKSGAPDHRTPDEISVLYPDGAGGHTQIRFTVTGAFTAGDQQGELARDEYQTVHWFRPSDPEGGRIDSVSFRGPPK